MALLVMRFSQIFCYLQPARFRHPHLHPIIEHCHYTSVLWGSWIGSQVQPTSS
jgi:hypothetical protein